MSSPDERADATGHSHAVDRDSDEYIGEWCFADQRGYLILKATKAQGVFFQMPGHDLPIMEKQVDNMIKVLTTWKEHRNRGASET